jgi:hypothetical protein
MLRPIVRIWYRMVVRLFWNKVPGLMYFHATEAESAWQLQRMIHRIESPTIQRDVFEHYLEEMQHAEIFADQAKRTAQTQGFQHLPRVPVAERQPIIGDSEPVWKFFAFLFVGEASAVKQFSRITHALPESGLKKALRSILRDEAKHVSDAKHHANMLSSKSDLDDHFRFLKRESFKSTWKRQGLKITDAVSSWLLWAVYWVIAPMGYLSAKRKLFGVVEANQLSEKEFVLKELEA